MARNDRVATRYARAIYDYLKDEKTIRSAIEDLNRFGDVVEGNKELSIALNSALFPGKVRSEIVADVAAKMKMSDQMKRILGEISDQKRIANLKGIASRLNEYLLESADIVPMDVLSASELSSGEKSKIQSKFEKVFEKKVEATYQVDPGLIGGVKVSARGRTYDGSVSGWLGSLGETLVGGRI